MISQAKVNQNMTRLNDALRGANVTMPRGTTNRVVGLIYSDEQNFPMMGGDWVFSLEALASVGKAMFGNEWTGKEFAALYWHEAPVEAYKRDIMQQKRAVELRQYVPSSLASANYSRHETKEAFEARKQDDLQRITDAELKPPVLIAQQQRQWEVNNTAFDRLTKAAKWLGDKCRNADIKTGYGSFENLSIVPGQAHYWNCVNDLLHWVKDGSIEVFLQNVGRMHRSKAYISRTDLAREIKTLTHSETTVSDTDLSRLPPYLRFAVNMALAHNWLIDGKQETTPVREAEIAEKWADAFPDIRLSKTTKEAIAKVLGIPDAVAINRSVSASTSPVKK